MVDDYTRKYMGGDRVRFLTKSKLPRFMSAIMLGAFAVSAGSALVGGAPFWVPILSGAAMFTAWAMLAEIRVAVSDTHLHIQYGVFGPRIALGEIVGVEAIEYPWLRYGGWGIRYAIGGGWAYTIPGAKGRAVRVRYRDGSREKIVVVSSADADALARAIVDAQAAAAGRTLDEARAALLPAASADGAVPVRTAADDALAREAEAEVEALINRRG